MKRHFALGVIGAVLLAGFFSSRTASAQTAAPAVTDKPTEVVTTLAHESLRITLDPGWYEANKLRQGPMALRQFLPEGDTKENIHRMINVAVYMNRPQSARQFMMDNKKEMDKLLATKAAIAWKTVSDDSPGDVTFEYSVKNLGKAPDQYEMQRVIQGKDALYDVIYHLAKPDPSPTEKQQILTWLKSVQLVNGKQEHAGSVRSGRP